MKKHSAVSAVKRSGFELVTTKESGKGNGKLATERDFAKIDWKPWKREKGMKRGGLLPSAGSFERCYVPARFAYATMLMERKDLIEMHGKVDHGYVDKLMANFVETSEWLKGVVRMIDVAYLRTLASGAAFNQKGGKFPGVHDMRKTKRARRLAR
jgi:hypothetical protein